MPKIFISYRREDTAGHARHLFEELARRYGKKNVFMDVATIAGGERWAERIDDEVARCDAFVALIGSRWLDARDAEGHRRLEAPGDYVRREVASGLGRDVVVIPVLVDGAAMPSETDLPDEIDELSRRNAVELTSARWDYELERLLELLPPPPRRWLIRSAVALAALLAVAAGAYLAWRALETPLHPMGGVFNVGVLELGERRSLEAPVEASAPGRWIAERVFENLEGARQAIESEDADMRGIVEVRRLAEHPRGTTAPEIEASLSELASRVDATLLMYGVLDLSEPPYRFTPSLYLTQDFNGGEELTGETSFGRPIPLALPLDETGPGTKNRLELANRLGDRLEALHLFTLGLAYLQIEDPARALELFDRAAVVEGWETGKELLHLFRGSALMLLGRRSEAQAAYELALEEGGPGYARALLGLGNLFFAAGRVDRAAELYRRALATEDASPLALLGSKARFNLGMTLAFQASGLGQPCDAPEAASTLAEVVEAYRAAPEDEVLRELAFKAEYQRGLLAQRCGTAHGERSEAARAAYEESLGYLRAAVELAEPRPLAGGEGPIEERRWQRSRWQARRVLAYSQLRLAELGRSELRAEAVATLEEVTARYERALGEVSEEVAADAYALLARALEGTDPAAAARYRELSEEVRAAATSSG